MISDSFFHRFKQDISGISLPERFTFPFYYDPHPLARLASEELKDYLTSQQDFTHNFGLNTEDTGLVIGKMFGVLVVQDQSGELGFLAAVSGKLANSNHHRYFVPPVFDLLDQHGFFLSEEQEVIAFTRELESLEQSGEYQRLKAERSHLEEQAQIELKAFKTTIKEQKKQRDLRRSEVAGWVPEEQEEVLETLRKQSVGEQFALKKLQQKWKATLADIESRIAEYEGRIQEKREQRAAKSADLQERIFGEYTFLNADGDTKSLKAIFSDSLIGKITDGRPPAGAGECAAPKLLHYAFKKGLKPLCLAEFWWGESPKSEVRIHEHFYPACRGKCEPILGHMLTGLEVDPNPMLENPAEEQELPVIYEDEHLVLVNKPAEFLSVPGKTISDSVYTRIRERYPDASGPLIVHRLDMSTSGLMVLALTSEVYQKLQQQFIKRKVNKRYVAVLDGEVQGNSGSVELPLRVDLEDRPRQMVCYEHGKHALTTWEKITVKNGKTRVHFYPHTGRTHQLRVHAAHSKGLNAPIIGDDLYGKKAKRLHLHAAYLEFTHPATRERVSFQVDPDF